MERKPKIDKTIGWILIFYVGFCDLIGIFLLVFGLDDLGILDMMTSPITQVYFRVKGVRGDYDLFASGIELIPWVGGLPIKTVGVYITLRGEWRDAEGKGGLLTKARNISRAKNGQMATNPNKQPINIARKKTQTKPDIANKNEPGRNTARVRQTSPKVLQFPSNVSYKDSDKMVA